MNKFFQKHNLILFLILLFLLIKIPLAFFENEFLWDDTVYLGVGKYIYSLGNSGFIEDSRPLIWPLILGLFWKLGANPVFFKILELIFASGSIYLTYLIAKNIFNEEVGLVSALFLAFSPTFFFFSTIALSGVPSLFFSLLGVYFFINKKYFATGLFAGIAFMTRFIQLFIFLTLILVLFIYFNKEKTFFKKTFKLLIGFSFFTIPYLIFNFINYGNIFYPFLLQNILVKTTGFIYHIPFWFYFIFLFKENFLYILSFFGIFLILRKKSNIKKTTIVLIFSIFFIFLNLIKHKEMRLLIVILPYLYILTSYMIIDFKNKLKNKNKIIFLTIVFTLWFLQSFSSIYSIESNELQQENKYSEFIKYLNENDELGIIWSSNPILSLYTNNRINELVYYPTFNEEKFNHLKNNIQSSDTVFYDSCDILCEPIVSNCNQNKLELVELFKKDLNIEYEGKFNECQQFIFIKS